MSLLLNARDQKALSTALLSKGLRSTKQRASVYCSILDKQDHPTADDILIRVRKKLPSISLATVYNCLETLVDCGLVRQVNLDRASTRFCPNLAPHAHFKCIETGKIFDLPIDEESFNSLQSILPQGFKAQNFELSFSGSVNHSLN
jgi:Fur family transcriptional regulator, peroxide stress response regulator